MAERRIFDPNDEPILWAIWVGPDDDGDWYDGFGDKLTQPTYGVITWVKERLIYANEVQLALYESGFPDTQVVPYMTVGVVMEAIAAGIRQQAASAPKWMKKQLGKLGGSE